MEGRASVACFVASSLLVALSTKGLALAVGHSAWTFLAFAVVQAAAAVLLLLVAGMLGLSPGHKLLSMRRVQQLGAAPLLYTLLLVASLQSLKRVAFPTLILFRHVSACVVALGDRLLYNVPVGPRQAGILAGMLCSTLAVASNDLLLDAKGCYWMTASGLLAAAYVLYLRHCSKAASAADVTLTYYNNLAAVLLLGPAAVLAYFDSNSYSYIFYTPYSWQFAFLASLNLLGGLVLSLSSFWAMRAVSSRTFAVLAAASRIPLALAGSVCFVTRYTPLGWAAGGVGLLLAVAHAACRPAPPQSAPPDVRFRYGPSTASIMKRVDSDLLLTPMHSPVEERLLQMQGDCSAKQAVTVV